MSGAQHQSSAWVLMRGNGPPDVMSYWYMQQSWERHCGTDEGKGHPGWGLPLTQRPLCSYQPGNGCRSSCTLWARASVKITLGSQREKTTTEEEGEDGSKQSKNRNIFKRKWTLRLQDGFTDNSGTRLILKLL